MVTPYGQLQKWIPDQETIFYFIYISIVKITGEGLNPLMKGQRVQFDILKGQCGSQAENVSKI
ncbi:cold shock domain-containing protein [Bacillus sp. ISL-53]|nr:cold shock domain-containing protein [Bacillus sp. ISL-53]